MVGAIGLSTANIVERVGFAHDVGFRTFQTVPPSWGALNDDELITFFKNLCGTFPDSQFLHYNLPRAKRILGGAEYRRLIDTVPTSGGLPGAADLMCHSSELQHFFGEWNFPHGCMFGECSLLASFGPMTPHKTWKYFEVGRTQQIEKLFRLQHDFHRACMDILSPVWDKEWIDGAYDKIIVRLGGLEEMPLRLLPPYQSFTEYQACKRILHEKYPDWVRREL